MQADIPATILGLVGLQEGFVGIELDGQQVRRLEDAALLAKVLADALLLGEGISHRSCSCAAAAARPLINCLREFSSSDHGGSPFMGATPRFSIARQRARPINYLISTFAPA